MVTPTPREDVQIPEPGSVIPAGESYSVNDIVVTVHDDLYAGDSCIAFSFSVKNERSTNYILRYSENAFHLKDDLGVEYPIDIWQDGIEAATLKPNGTLFGDLSCYLSYFDGPITINAKYLFFTMDEMAGMTDLNWVFDLQ